MILRRYILQEIWPTYLASLFVAVFLMVATKMLSIMEMIVNHGVSLLHVLRMVIYLLPDIVAFALPAISLMAVLIAFLRLSSDSEVIALKSAGLSLYQLLTPVLWVALLGLLASGFLTILAMPWGNRSFKDLLFQIVQVKADLGIKERVFSEPFDGVTFYVGQVSPKQRLMEDVFVVDRRDPETANTIVAEKGSLWSRPEDRTLGLHFVKGTIFVVGKRLESARTIAFETYDLVLDLGDLMASLETRKKKPHELGMAEIFEKLSSLQPGSKERNDLLRELIEKFSMPLAVFLMAIIGVPLGVQIRTRGRASGIWLSLVVFAFYYIFLAGARSMASSGFLSPLIGVWIPDLLLLAFAWVLIRRAAREKPLFGFRTFRNPFGKGGKGSLIP